MHIIAGLCRHQTIITPKGMETRPSSEKLRETLFNICQSYILDAKFLDLFAGSGAMGLEALSRGAVKATFVDNGKEAIRCIRQNLEALHLESYGEVFFGDVFSMMEKFQKQGLSYDIIFADPPYGMMSKNSKETYSTKLVRMIDLGSLLAPSGTLFVEESKETLIPVDALTTLTLKSSRRIGQSFLLEFQKSL